MSFSSGADIHDTWVGLLCLFSNHCCPAASCSTSISKCWWGVLLESLFFSSYSFSKRDCNFRVCVPQMCSWRVAAFQLCISPCQITAMTGTLPVLLWGFFSLSALSLSFSPSIYPSYLDFKICGRRWGRIEKWLLRSCKLQQLHEIRALLWFKVNK